MQLSFEKLSLKLKNGRTIFQNVTGSVEKGEILAIFSESEQEKSALLDTFTGRLHASSIVDGKILVDGQLRDPQEWIKKFRYLPRKDTLYKNETIYECFQQYANLENSEKVCSNINADLRDYIKRFNLENVKHTKIKNVSKNHRKITAILCAIINQPEILFLYDPFSDLSAYNRKKLYNLLLFLSREKGITIILTTNYLDSDLYGVFNKIIYLYDTNTIFVGTIKTLEQKIKSIGVDIPNDINLIKFLNDSIAKEIIYCEKDNKDSISNRLKSLYNEETKNIMVEENKNFRNHIFYSYTPSFYYIGVLIKRWFRFVYAKNKETIYFRFLIIILFFLARLVIHFIVKISANRVTLNKMFIMISWFVVFDRRARAEKIFENSVNLMVYLDSYFTSILFAFYNLKIFSDMFEIIKSEKNMHEANIREFKYNQSTYFLSLFIYTYLTYLLNLISTMYLLLFACFEGFIQKIVFLHAFIVAPLFLMLSYGYIQILSMKYINLLMYVNKYLILFGYDTYLREINDLSSHYKILKFALICSNILVFPFALLIFFQYNILLKSEDFLFILGYIPQWARFMLDFETEILVFKPFRNYMNTFIVTIAVLWFLMGLAFVIYTKSPRYKI
ncbi:hypothetical protein EDEG_03884 [Edhazardia aedis USNM 41457]|uniref:ABC transporter domain-containing protein n=1 Tax=Edhazardia aedis (strain USNM 41457) TaxID=1003232 RepID=J9D152_EDHAE|nr:hypothetical protein EDEG_03884 [Edhazardia aedis USNM 41457]|eukprot:EJW01551.1 hypothetical protein EDEG_03884 [Edhazardia aedis USNM 41457]